MDAPECTFLPDSQGLQGNAQSSQQCPAHRLSVLDAPVVMRLLGIVGWALCLSRKGHGKSVARGPERYAR